MRESFKALNFTLCHFMYCMSHFHKSSCISNTFMKTNTNTACCPLKEVLWDLPERCANSLFQFVPSLALFLKVYSSSTLVRRKYAVPGLLLATHYVEPCQSSHLPENFVHSQCSVSESEEMCCLA